ncbi:OmpA family protein [Flavobacteriaceae bacterium R38]|nr:OmpA family protein [Flavobacteriaceae bacterium R38]
MQRLHYLIFIFFFSFSASLSAQYGTQKRADALFDKFAYVKAISAYKKLVEREYNVDHAKRRLADSYTFLRDSKNAIKYYKDVVNQSNVPVEYYYKYAQALKAEKQYDEAVKWITKFKENGGDISHLPEIDENTYSGSIFAINPKYEIDTVAFNSDYSDFGAYERDGIIYFSSTRNEGVSIKRRYSWNQQPFLDLYAVQEGASAATHKDRLNSTINTRFHEASISITPDGNTMYFSRNSYYKNRRGRDNSRITHLKVYSAEKVNGTWENVQSISVNSDDYSVTHPAISPDGKYLYFASDMPGGFGGMDLYKAEISSNGTLVNTVNLGETVNTTGDDVFPFINNEGVLFFSSDGHVGLGLLDIFSATKNDSGEYVDVINIGAPVNSNQDDFSFFLKDDGVTGYFTSNRGDNIYDDDIYTFTKIPPLKLKGHVTDSISTMPIPNAILVLKDDNDQLIAQVETDEKGYYEIDVERNVDYTLTTLKEGYNEKVTSFTTKNVPLQTTEIIVDIVLSRIPFTEEEFPVINNIYFNFDRSNVRNDAQEILDRVVYLMTEKYPEMKIKISSHTDSRGSSKYNLILSQRRANSTLEYLLDHGIRMDRILESKGYGEEKLITSCPNGVECTEHEHQLNRRTEFLIISLR